MTTQEADKLELLNRLRALCAEHGDEIGTLDPIQQNRTKLLLRRLAAPTKVVLAGVGSADQHGLAEFFLGESLFSSTSDVSKLPLIHVRHGNKSRTHVFLNGKRRTIDGCSVSEAMSAPKPDAIGLELPIPIAAQIGFSILPVHDRDDDRTQYVTTMLDNTDIVIWCSKIAAVWSSQERKIWADVPAQTKSRSILALTRAEDLKASAAKKAFDEIHEITRGDFRCLAGIAVDRAKKAAPSGLIADAASFSDSGGQAILNELMALVQSCQRGLIYQAQQLISELEAVELGSEARAPAASISELQKTNDSLSDVSPLDQVRLLLNTNAAACIDSLKTGDDEDFSALFESMTKLIAELSMKLKNEVTLDTEHELVTSQVEEAGEMVGLLSYEGDAKAAREASEITRQISIDVWSRIQSRTSNIDKPNLTKIEQGLAAS